MRSDIIDITGRRFGRWTVLRYAESRRFRAGQQQTYWLARCDCGTEKAVHGQILRTGRSTRCADCAHIYNAGDRFGTRTLVSRGPGGWRWRCDCGATGLGPVRLLARSKCHGCKPSAEWPNAKPITFNGLTLTSAEWAERLGISRQAMNQRFTSGWPLERALTARKERR